MASLLKNGTNYGLIWTDNDRRPKQVRESLKTDNLKKARLKKKQLEWEYLNGDHDPWEHKWYERGKEPSLLIGPLVELFIAYKSKAKGREGWSEDVMYRESYVMRKFVRHTGPLPIGSLSEKHLESFYYRSSVSSDHTRQGDYISINTFLNWCIKQGFLSGKPEYRPGKPQRKLPKYIHPSELSVVINYRLQKMKDDLAAGLPRNEEELPVWIPLCWMMLAGTGMRPVELCNLKVHHFSGDCSTAIIGEDFTTKTRQERKVPILYEARQASQLLTSNRFREMQTSLRSSQLLTGCKPNYARNKLSRDFTDSWKACYPGKPKRTLYNLKDMFAVRFLCDDSVPSPSGMKLNDLREILGHSSLETTQKYLKAIPFGTNIQGCIWDFTASLK